MGFFYGPSKKKSVPATDEAALEERLVKRLTEKLYYRDEVEERLRRAFSNYPARTTEYLMKMIMKEFDE